MKRISPRIFIALLLLIGLIVAGIGTFPPKAAHAYSNNDLIDDSVFDNNNSMSAAQIQTFLNQFPNSCIKNYQAPDPQSWYNYGGLVSAAQVIKDASTIWGINPKVLLTTMEKEEGLVRGDGAYGCSNTSYWSAMGYNCPGSATYTYSTAQITASPDNYAGGLPGDLSGGAGPTCAASAHDVGFSAQVSHGAWQLEFGRQRSEGNGNLSWDGDNTVTYYGYMTAGNRARVQGGTVSGYSGVVTLNDNNVVTLTNGATASLYSYTPYIQSFDTIYEGFFGSGSTSANAYSASFYNQSSSPVTGPGTTAPGWIEYTNSGSSTWYDDASIGGAPAGSYPIHLSTTAPLGRASVFAGGNWQGGNNRPDMTFSAVYNSDGTTLASNQHVAQPGQIVKFAFTFTVAANQAPGTYQENFQPVAEGTPTGAFADPGTFLDVTVTTTYASTYATEGSSPLLLPGQSAQTYISYQNSGNAPWYDDVSAAGAGAQPVHLATSHSLNRNSVFGSTWGTAQDRPATTFATVYNPDGTTLAANQHIVQPGQIAKFSFTLTAPTQTSAASYTEYFQPIVEGGSTMNDPGTYLQPSIISGSVGNNTDGSQTINLLPGASTSLTLHFTNVGNTTWTSGSTNLLADTSTNVQSFHASSWTSSTVVSSLNESSVAPGSSGSFNITLQAPGTVGSYTLGFAPSNNSTYFGDSAAAININVQPLHYAAQFYNQSASPTIVPGSTAPGWIEYTNTSNAAWYDDTSIGGAPAGSYPIHLSTTAPLGRASVFAGGNWQGGGNRPAMTFTAVYNADGVTLASNQHVAQPGQVVEFAFTFTVATNQAPGTYRENFQPVAEGTPTGAFADPGTAINVVVKANTYAARFYNQSASPVVAPGSTAPGWIEYTNTSNVAWYDDTSIGGAPAGSYPIHLSTAAPVGRASRFAGGNWQGGSNRPGMTFTAVYNADGVTLASNQHVAQPGQVVEFAFTFTVAANQTPGTYQENFQPVAEGTPTGAFADPGTFLDVTVKAPSYTAQFYNQSASPVVAPGSTAPGWLEYTNTSNAAWYDDTSIGGAPAGSYPIHLSTTAPLGRASVFAGGNWQGGNNRPDMTFSAVYNSDGTTLASNQHVAQPGQIVKFAFTFTVAANQAPGTYQENFQPVAEGTPTGAFADPGTFLDVTVQ